MKKLIASVSDGATALKCAEANGSSDEIVDLLCLASKNATAALEKQPGKFFPPVTDSCSSSRNEPQEILQTGAGNYKSYQLFPPSSDSDSSSTDGQNHRQTGEQHQQIQNFKNLKGKTVIEGDRDAPLTDEFMVYSFKVEQCPEIHCEKNQKDCPFLHHGEKHRRRDPIKHSYEPIFCPRFEEGTCDQGDACRSAHGKFEVRFHPKRYRRKFCYYGLGCSKKFCSFAHDEDQFRTFPPSRTAHRKSSVPSINQSLAHPGWNIPSHQQQQGNSMEEIPSGSSQPICTNFLAPAADPAIPISDNEDFNLLGGDIYGNGATCSSVTPQSLQALPLNNVAPPARTHSSTIGRENHLSNLTSSSSTSFPTWVPTTFHDEGLPNLEQTDSSYQAPNMGMINSTSPRLSNNDSSIGGGI
ncbi:hypothetical protein L1049_008208 [Liquidambar formosana]|uniref:C3H1-type domain-containing protein n=1 Tax=Liquidambar formosana TaxID=63359 RepID=A0AAP0S9B5_LIQFO